MTENVKKRGGYKGGSRKGVPNKATAGAREAIAAFVDDNAHRLQDWLTAVAEGITEPGTDDKPGRVLIAPNPARAFELFQSVVEYHIPKLARTELTGKDGAPVATTITHVYEDAAPWKEPE